VAGLAVIAVVIGVLAMMSGGGDDDGGADATTVARTTVATSTSAAATSAATSTSAAPSTSTGTTIAGIPGEIFLEPRTGVGPDPFTPSVDTTPVELSAPTDGGPLAPGAPFPTVPPSPSTTLPGTVEPVRASSPGLYGGTRSNKNCDKAQLVTFLQENPEKAATWATVQNIQPNDIPAFVEGLTPGAPAHRHACDELRLQGRRCTGAPGRAAGGHRCHGRPVRRAAGALLLWQPVERTRAGAGADVHR
jgi:hypothetical protein